MSDPNPTRTDLVPFEELPPSPPRDKQGRFQLGHPGPALRHGTRSELVRAGHLTNAAQVLAEQRMQLYAELGGGEALDVVVMRLADQFITLSAVAEYLAQRLQHEGPITGKGRTRASLTAYQRVVDSLDRLAQRLGYERPKPGQSASRPERSAHLDNLTDEEIAAIGRVLDAAKARRADEPVVPPNTFAIELPDDGADA